MIAAADAALYQRIAATFRARIADGTWSRGCMLPGRHALARELGVSLRTVERAMAGLLADGTVRADDRRGTFVGPLPAPEPGRDGLVAVVVRSEVDLADAVDPGRFWTPTVARALERELAAAGTAVRWYHVELLPGSHPDLAAACAAVAADGAADLAVLSPAGELGWGADLERCWAPGLPPAVVVAGDAVEIPPPAVFPEQRRAGYDAARHLLDAGYRTIAGLADRDASWLAARLAGAEAATRQRGATWLRLGDPAAIPRLPHDAAVIAPNDAAALDLLGRLRERGLRPGRDLGVIGFDDDHAGRVANLSTLAPPLEDLGRAAARVLVERRRGGPVPATTRLAHRLLPRDSTRRES